MISRETIDEVRNRVDIVDVVGDFVSLKKSGSSFKALSPFTNEKTPSFYVVPGKGIFKDFSSGKGGDAITFVMEHEGISYPEAIRYLARKYGIEIKEDAGSSSEPDTTDRDSLYIIMSFARDYFQALLHDSEEGRSVGKSYFHERGLNDTTIRAFELGYSMDAWDGLTSKALKSGYSEDVLERSGLAIRKDKRLYDRFRGRVIFPVHNLAGKVIAFGARILGKEKDQPKYVNSPETDIYQKGHTLYGMYQARNAIRKDDFCYLVEGYTDVLSLHQAGIQNVVASSGTALTEEQIKLIARFTDNVTVLYDGDEAGIKAALRGVDLALKGGLNVRVVVLPVGEDPDSFAGQRSAGELTAYLKEKARDFISFKIDLLAKDALNDPIRKAELIRELATSIALIPDPLKRSVYIQECSRKLDVPHDILGIEIKKIVFRKRREDGARQEEEELKTSMSEVHTLSKTFLLSPQETLLAYERELIKVLLLLGHQTTPEGHHVYDVIFSETDDVDYVDERHQEILDRYHEAIVEGRSVKSDDFVKHLPEALARYVADFVIRKYELSEGWKRHRIYVGEEYEWNEAPIKAIRQLKLGIVQKMLFENMEKLKDCKDKREEEGLLQIQFDIDQYKNTIGNELGRFVLASPKLLSPN